jgi:hypothetical protein
MPGGRSYERQIKTPKRIAKRKAELDSEGYQVSARGRASAGWMRRSAQHAACLAAPSHHAHAAGAALRRPSPRMALWHFPRRRYYFHAMCWITFMSSYLTHRCAARAGLADGARG